MKALIITNKKNRVLSENTNSDKETQYPDLIILEEFLQKSLEIESEFASKCDKKLIDKVKSKTYLYLFVDSLTIDINDDNYINFHNICLEHTVNKHDGMIFFLSSDQKLSQNITNQFHKTFNRMINCEEIYDFLVLNSLPIINKFQSSDYLNKISNFAEKNQIEDFDIIGFYHEDMCTYLFKAKQKSIKRTIVLHILKPEFNYDGDFFIKNISNHSQIQTENIELIFEGGVSKSKKKNYFYTRQRISHQTLYEMILNDKKLTEKLYLDLFFNISKAKKYLASKKVPKLNTNVQNIFYCNEHGFMLKNRASIFDKKTNYELDEITKLASDIETIEPTKLSQSIKDFISKIKNKEFKYWKDINTELSEIQLETLNDIDSSSKKTHSEKSNSRLFKNKKTSKLQKNSTSANYKKKNYPESHSTNLTKKTKVLFSFFILIALLITAFLLKKQKYIPINYINTEIFLLEKDSEKKNNNDFNSNNQDQIKEKLVKKEILVSKYEITIAQYAEFLKIVSKKNHKQKYDHPKQPSTKKNHKPKNWELIYKSAKKNKLYSYEKLSLNHPIFNVDWWDAYAFAKWQGGRLPTKNEWQSIAQGVTKNKFPWGNDLKVNFFNSGLDFSNKIILKGTKDGYNMWAPVDAHPNDSTINGIQNLAGNVSEWTSSWGVHPYLPFKKIPQICGSSFATKDNFELSTDRYVESPEEKISTLGFRVIKSK